MQTISTACGVTEAHALTIYRLSQSTDIRADYRGGHYFDAATLRWFGASRFATVAPGASVELQSKAPVELGSYHAQIWRDGSDGTPEPWFGCQHFTRREATQCARKTAASLR